MPLFSSCITLQVGHYHVCSPKAAIRGIILAFWSSQRACDHGKSKLAPGCSFAACEPRPLGCLCPPRSGLKPWAGMGNLPWSPADDRANKLLSAAFRAFPKYYISIKDEKTCLTGCPGHFPQPHTLPRLAPVSYI